MPISSLYLENFKGVYEGVEIEVRPLTLFVGANSSGKSSCIHALAAMAQTMKLPNDRRPLVLDDEFASVHLGRFIEVIHSKSYSDSMRLGISVRGVGYREPDNREPNTTVGIVSSVQNADARCCYCFRSTRRTQDIRLEGAEISIGPNVYSASKGRLAYDVKKAQVDGKIRLQLQNGFAFDMRVPFVRQESRSRFLQYMPMFQAQRAVQRELAKTVYLGPFRQAPQRRYPTRGSSPKDVGAQGESTITLLANEIVQRRSRRHLREITQWLQTMGLAKKLDVARIATSDLFDVKFTLGDGETFPLADLGYGLSQVLPVLTQCSFAEEGSTLLFEQPELHLHTLAVRPLAKVFIDAAKTKKLHIVAETHSRELVSQFQRELRDGSITMKELVIYKVSRQEGRSVIEKLDIDPETFDIYDRWETGIFTDV